MSDSVMFDTHRHVKELAAHGLSEACAESIVKVVQEGLTHHVATKADLAEFRGSLREDMAEFRGSLREDMANLRADIASWKNELTWRLLGGFTAIAVLMVAAMKLL